MTGLLSAPIEVFMNQELIFILNAIHETPDERAGKGKDILCRCVYCTDILCKCCPFDAQLLELSPDDSFVAQIHKSMEAIS